MQCLYVAVTQEGAYLSQYKHGFFSHVFIDQAINAVRTPCLANTKRRPEGHDFCFSVPYMMSYTELPNTPSSAELQAQFIQTIIYKRCLDFSNLFICSNNLDHAIKSRSLKFSSNMKRSMSGWLEDEIRIQNDRMKKKYD